MSAASSQAAGKTPIEYWDALVYSEMQSSPRFAQNFIKKLRAEKLTFGNRVHCPFLRPFFLSPEDEDRVKPVAETIAELGERITNAALADQKLLAQFHLRPEEERLARLPGSQGRVSTASRLDAFLLPESLKFAEYNGESPAGAGYSEMLAGIFADLPVMEQFGKRFQTHSYPLSAKLLDALVRAYLDWGGTTKRPQIAIVDFKGVPTWREFEILQGRFRKMGVPTLVAEPKELEFDGHTLTAKKKKIDLVYRRALINDLISRPDESAALVNAYAANAVCVANSFRCKIPHVKTFFAVLTDEQNQKLFSHAELAIIRKHVPWTRVVADIRTMHYDASVDLLAYIRRERQNFVLKPSDEYGGTGVTLGWETTESAWDAAISAAVSDSSTPAAGKSCWIVQERIPIRREIFPHITPGGDVEFRDMLVDFAPYLFRGKLAGYLTRLSATGLANVTSGGGQVPAFRVAAK